MIAMKRLVEDQYKTFKRIEQSNLDLQKNPATSEEDISNRRNALSKYYQKFQKVDTEIEDIVTEEKLDTRKEKYFKEDLVCKCDEIYSATMGKLSEIKSDSDNEPSVSKRQPFKLKEEAVPPPKLAKLDVAKFSGTLTEWPAFSRQYNDLVHSTNYLTNSEKFEYLKSVLPPEDFELIASLYDARENHDNSYKEAWEKLKNKFNNGAVIEAFLHKLLEQRFEVNQSEYFIGTLSNCLDELRILIVDSSSWDVFVIYNYVQKMDRVTKKEWLVSHSSLERLKLPTLYCFLSLKRRNLKCVDCRMFHNLWVCPGFNAKNIDQRLKFVKNKMICVRCLQTTHILINCPKLYRCHECGDKDHHTLLHRRHRKQ